MAPDWRGCSLAVLFMEGGSPLKLLSCFADEAGQQDMGAGYYLLTLVLHDQADDIAPCIAAYEARLAFEGLPDTPFHGVDLLHGHGRYETQDAATRKRLLVAFSMFVRTLPIKYKTFAYNSNDVVDAKDLRSRMRRDIVNFIFEHLSWFQGYDSVPIYYDGGHSAVTVALHEAFDYALARDVAIYKELSHETKRLAQAADYLCSIELANVRYEAGDVSSTYERFYGNARKFKQNYLKQAKRKRID